MGISGALIQSRTDTRYPIPHVLLALVVLLALTALAAWPFLTRPGLPRHTDAELHVFRAAQLGEALRGGAGYVRWAPDLWYGYGYPIFNYYSPLTYYLANLLVLFGLDVVNAVKALFVLGLLSAAAGMYVFVRSNWGERAGIVAAAAYVFSPYILFIDPHMRGDLAEFFALVLFPWLLWTFQISILNSQSSMRTLLGVLMWAALIMTHALMALLLSVLLIAWLVWQLVSVRFARSLLKLEIWNLTFVLGLAAIYWLPFVFERNAVHLSVVGPGQFDFHNHFVAWRDLFAASPTLDLGATSLKYIRSLGLAQWVLALLGLLAVLARRRSRGHVTTAEADTRNTDRLLTTEVVTTGADRLLLFFALCSAFLIFLMLSPSTFIWEHVPLMSFIQFPWRLLGPVAATLAICAAAAIPNTQYLFKPQWLSEGVAVAALLAILALALPTMYPPMWSGEEWPTSPRGVIGVELEGWWLGTTSTGDFVPSTVKSHPPANADLIASYERSMVDKFDHTSLPQDATLVVLEHGPTRDRFTVTSPEPFTARVLTFDFPGWYATVDGQPVPVTPSDPHGFITFPVPAGAHEVCIEFGSTLPRTVGALVSMTTLLVLAWFVIRQVARGARRKQETVPIPNLRAKRPIPNTQYLWLALGVVIVFAAIKIGAVDQCENCFRVTSPPGQAWVAQSKIDPQATPSDLAHVITLLGFDLPQREVRAGGSFPITLYWKATAPVPKNYQVFVHLVNQQLWGQPLRDKLNPGDFPTTRWPLDKYVWDDYRTPESIVRVRPDAPPGEYEIRVGLYTLADGVRAPVYDANGNPAGDSVVLPIKVYVLPAR